MAAPATSSWLYSDETLPFDPSPYPSTSKPCPSELNQKHLPRSLPRNYCRLPDVEQVLADHRAHVRPAFDSKLMDDDRCLSSLLHHENLLHETALLETYDRIQLEIRPYMRNMVVDWMRDVCEEEKSGVEVFVLSVNYLDRFLSIQDIFKTQLQGLAASCLFLASKVKLPVPFSSPRLAAYTDHSVTVSELMSWELLLLNKLNWDMAGPSAPDLADRVLTRMCLPTALSSKVRPALQATVSAIQSDHGLAVLPTTMQACACICVSGVRVLDDREALGSFLCGVEEAVGLDQEMIRFYVEAVEKYLGSASCEEGYEDAEDA